MNSYDELVKAFSMIKPDVAESFEYRIHYDETGKIFMCTMQQHPVDTKYIVVTKEEYDNYFRYYVDNGELKLIPLPKSYQEPLTKETLRKTSVKKHAAILYEKSNH